MTRPGTKRRRGQRGMTLIELMIAITILAVGLSALIALIMAASATNNRNRVDTSGTFVAQIFMENIINQPGGGNITMTDCAGNTITIYTAGPATAGTSNGANLKSDGSGIDFTQAASGIATGYKATYVSCGSGGRTTSYDVRWNVRTISTYSKLVTVSARHTPTIGTGSSVAGMYFQTPVNLRTIMTN